MRKKRIKNEIAEMERLDGPYDILRDLREIRKMEKERAKTMRLAPPVVMVTDGSAKPRNPGPMAIGCFFRTQDGVALGYISRELGRRGTNNQAEYIAFIEGLKHARDVLGADHVEAWVDSELVQRQLSGVYRVRAHDLKGLYRTARQLIRSIGVVSIRWAARDQRDQPIADALSKCNTELAEKLISESYPFADSGGFEDHWVNITKGFSPTYNPLFDYGGDDIGDDEVDEPYEDFPLVEDVVPGVALGFDLYPDVDVGIQNEFDDMEHEIGPEPEDMEE